MAQRIVLRWRATRLLAQPPATWSCEAALSLGVTIPSHPHCVSSPPPSALSPCPAPWPANHLFTFPPDSMAFHLPCGSAPRLEVHRLRGGATLCGGGGLAVSKPTEAALPLAQTPRRWVSHMPSDAWTYVHRCLATLNRSHLRLVKPATGYNSFREKGTSLSRPILRLW